MMCGLLCSFATYVYRVRWCLAHFRLYCSQSCSHDSRALPRTPCRDNFRVVDHREVGQTTQYKGVYQELTARGLTKLAKLDEDQGHIVSERTVSPLSDAVQDGLLHLGEGLL